MVRQDILKVFVSCLAAGESTRLVAAPRDDLVVRASERALSSGQGLADHQLAVVVVVNAIGYQV